MIPGSSTNSMPSLSPTFSKLNHLRITHLIGKKLNPSTQPYGARAVWIGFKQTVTTFIRSALFTVSRLVM